MLSVRSKVENRLSARLNTDDDAPYHKSKINITPTMSGSPEKFPTLYVKSLGEPSADDDLEQLKQCAIISTIELHSFSNKSLTEAYSLANKSGDVMLGMRYKLIYGPEPISTAKPFEVVTRYRRIVGDGDELY